MTEVLPAISVHRATPVYRMGGTMVPVISDPRCKVCNGPYRFDVDEYILVGTAFKKINDRLPEGVEYTTYCLRGHWKNHMSLEQSEAVGIVHRRAQRVGKRIEDAEESLVDGISLLETVVQRTFEKIAKGQIEPTLRDGLAAAQVLAQLGEYDDSELDQQAYVEAFSVYQDEARRIMGEDAFEAFGEALASNPVLAALTARYNGEDGSDDVVEDEGVSEDS